LKAQTDTVLPKFLNGFSEIYYSYDFSNPSDHTRPGFIYSHNRHNEVNLNLGFIKAGYKTKNTRANVAFMAGTYSNANLSAEPGVLKNIYEANAGVKISKNKNIWVDAGVFASHIGFESVHSPSCWVLTRSILAENSPYYETGVKVTSISNNEKWLLSGLILNGWQHIQRPNGNNSPAFGTQVTYTANSKFSINSSSFIGNDKPDKAKQMRYFHNLYSIYQLTSKVGVIVGFDIGAEQKRKSTTAYNLWYSPVLIIKVNLNDKFSIAIRGEYYSDESGVLIFTGTRNGFQTAGFSSNLDYLIAENVVWRFEGRGFNSKDKIFTLDKKPTNQNYFLTTSLAVTF